MLSRNNWKEQVRQQEPKKQRFTIKKLTIGVASVLIGFTFMGMSASADNQTAATGNNQTAATGNNQTAATGNNQAAATGNNSIDINQAGKGTKTETHATIPASYVRINARSLNTTKDKDKYPVSYKWMDIDRPTTSTSVTETEMPMVKNANTMPDGTITGYKQGNDIMSPDGVTTSVDSKTGEITVTVAKDANTGIFYLPVEISYKDGTDNTVYTTVSIHAHIDNSEREHQAQVTFISTLANLHRTTDDNPNIDVNNSRINTINIDYDWDHTNGNGNYRKTTVYKLNTDGTKFVNTTDPTDSFDASAFKYEWTKGYAPNTKFGTGTGTVLAQNNGVYNPEENYQMTYTITDPSVARKLNADTNSSSSMKVYFNFWGATTDQTLTFKQNQDISNLSQAQYRKLIDVTDLGANGWNGTNVDPSTPQEAAYTPGTDATKTFSMAWAPNGKPSTATVADGVKGTVRINFNDGTYLDVPATINVVKNNADTTTLIAPSKIVPSYDGTKVVDTPFYNNSRGTNSSLIDNQSKTGQYTFYFTAKDASGKEYASSYAAEKGNPTGVVLNSILDKDAGAYDPNSLEFHFYYQNNTDQDQTINYTLRMADYLNPYKAGRPESSLVPDGSRISDVKVTSKQGNTYDISSVTKTLDGVKSRDGDLRYVGDVPVNLTVKANDAINLVIPFVLNTTAKKSNTTIDDHNEFSVRENGQQTGYLVVRSSTYAPLFSKHKIYPLVNVGNNNYTHDYPDNPGAFDLDPSVYLDNDFMDGFWDGRTGVYKASKPTNLNTVYNSYTYTFLLLDNYQKSLTKHGFTVAFRNGKPAPYYMYQLSKTGSKVVDKNGNPVQGETKGHPYFEVVPVILLNQDETYTTKTAPTAWDPSTMVNKVADPTNYRYWDQKTDSAVRMDNTAAQLTAKDFTVTITKDGQAVKPDDNGKYDLSKPGTYTVTYSKDFNGTTISNSGQITVTPTNPAKPDNGNKGTDTPVTPSKPTDNKGDQPTTPTKPNTGKDDNKGDQSTTPTNPSKGDDKPTNPTAPTNPSKPNTGKDDNNKGDQPTNPTTPTKPDDNKSNKPVTPTNPAKPDNGNKGTDTPVTPSKPTDNKGDQPTTPTIPAQPDHGNASISGQAGHKPATSDNGTQNGNNNGINNGTQNGNGNKTVNTNVTDNGNGDKTVNTNVTDNGNGDKTVNTNVTDNSQNNKQALPQTGNTKNDAAVAGLGLAGLLAMLGLGGLKKKRN